MTQSMSTTTRRLAVGTTKGLFLGSDNGDGWHWSPPAFPMTRVAAVAFDERRDPVRMLVGGMHEHWGPIVASSDDLGATWTEDERAALRFPSDSGAAVAQVWQLTPGPVDRPDEVWAGVEPAALFRSTDGGRSFDLVEGLWRHPHRESWHPGFGGLCLHTVLPNPDDADDVLVGISTGGVYRTQDGGTTWAPSNRGIEARFYPDPYPELGQCVHKLVRLPDDASTLVLQNHGGVFGSSDAGATWEPRAVGLPADFGFGLAASSSATYLFPLVADAMRLPPDGQARVFASTDAGHTWQSRSSGLPERDFYSLVLRDALATDGRDGVYFGTRSGEVWASDDGAGSWEQVAAHLPDVLCVRALVQ
jgi:photosystem II stability/assembly factor-like uncharacterized protein